MEETQPNPALPAPIARFLEEAARRGLSDTKAAAALGMSATTVSRVRRGIYEGDLGAVADKAALALRLWQERGDGRRAFVETSIAAKVFTACDFALSRQTPVILTGESQIGKTTALEEYARRSDAPVRLVRMPAAANLPLFLEELAEALGVAAKPGERRRRILRALNDRTLLAAIAESLKIRAKVQALERAAILPAAQAAAERKRADDAWNRGQLAAAREAAKAPGMRHGRGQSLGGLAAAPAAEGPAQDLDALAPGAPAPAAPALTLKDFL